MNKNTAHHRRYLERKLGRPLYSIERIKKFPFKDLRLRITLALGDNDWFYALKMERSGPTFFCEITSVFLQYGITACEFILWNGKDIVRTNDVNEVIQYLWDASSSSS